MGRPRNPNPPIHIGRIRIPQDNGWTYVLEKTSQYDHERQQTKTISTRLIGKIPPGSSDYKDMVPTGRRGRPSKKDAEASTQATAADAKVARTETQATAADVKVAKPVTQTATADTQAAKPVTQTATDTRDVETNTPCSIDECIVATPEVARMDTRCKAMVKYSSAHVLVFLIWGIITGYFGCVRLAELWNASIDRLRQIFPDFPTSKISHDTIRRFIIMLGKDVQGGLFQAITQSILSYIRSMDVENGKAANERNVYPIDGQAVRASRVEPGSARMRYVLNIYDCNNELALEQEQVGEKTNEITHNTKIVERVNIDDGVVTTDALNSTTVLAYTTIEQGGDYCFAIKGNQKCTYENIESLFNDSKYEKLICEIKTIEKGHSRIEERTLKVLPASLLETDILEKWKGLKDGCIAMITSKRVLINKNYEEQYDTRYYISSLKFNQKYIENELLRIIRYHWHIESKLHYGLDVLYNQDRIQCKNTDFYNGITKLLKTVYNLSSIFIKMETPAGKEKISRAALQARLTNLSTFWRLFTEVTQKGGSPLL